jgi:putative transposase
LFHKEEDFLAFERVLAEGLVKYPVELFAYTLMPNHWHLVLRPVKDRQMGQLLRWVTATHTLRYRTHYHSLGGGHLYQGRFKSFAIGDDAHFLTVCRYVERNPLRANLAPRAADWSYGSLYRWKSGKDEPKLLSPWPIRRLPCWEERVQGALSEAELKSLRVCVERGRPYGNEEWTEEFVERHGLHHTMRPPGRPRKRPRPATTT